MQILDKIQRRLTVICIAVLFTITSALSVVCYLYFSDSLDNQIRQELKSLADSVLVSIDSIENIGKQKTGIPDAIIATVPIEGTAAPRSIRFEWFDPSGKLLARRGEYRIVVPFSPSDNIVEQLRPHAFVRTRPALYQHHIIGYLRIAHPLDSRDEILHTLLIGLVAGICCAALLGALGIRILIRHAMQPAATMFQTLKQFTVDASHELRNPIMAIRSNADAALSYSKSLSERDRRKLIAIRAAADQMHQLTDSLIELSRLDTTVASTHSTCDVGQACSDLVDRYKESSGKSIVVEKTLGSELYAAIDHLEIEKLIGNVIANAFQYTAEDGRIEITALRDADEIVIDVTDNGIGIESANIDKIFDRFWRADKARSRRTGGSGLGLPIARAVAEKNGGTLTVRSECGVGSTFTIRLPAARRQ